MKKLILASALLMATIPAQAFFQPKPKTTTDDFDGSTRVSMTEAALGCKALELHCPRLGYSWSSNTPDQLYVHVVLSDSFTKSYFNIRQMQMNVNGDIRTFDATGLTDFVRDSTSTQSWQSFALPIEYRDVFKNEKNVKIRIVTDKGPYDGVYSGGKKPSYAEKFYQLFEEELSKQNISQ